MKQQKLKTLKNQRFLVPQKLKVFVVFEPHHLGGK